MLSAIEDIPLVTKYLKKFDAHHSKEVGFIMFCTKLEAEETHKKFLKLEKKFKLNIEKLNKVKYYKKAIALMHLFPTDYE